MDETTAVIVVIGGIVLLIVFAIVMRFFGLWIQCVTTRADISLLNLILMRLRKVNPTVIVRSKIMATQAQLSKVFSISRQQLEAHYLAGGNVPNVIRALVASNRARLSLDFDTARAIDLAGRDVLDAVRTSVYPKVIDCPDPSKTSGTLDAVAGDGIQLPARSMSASLRLQRRWRWTSRRPLCSAASRRLR